MQPIDRREALRRASLLLGSALSASSIAAVLAGCGDSRAESSEWKPRALSADQMELVAVIAEHIIPTTDTPGARAALVHRFIDTMLGEYYTPSERETFVRGLADLDARAKTAHGVSFSSCTNAQQLGTLHAVDREAFGAAAPQPHYFRNMKELVVLGYYTSEIGATRELRYERVPGHFEGCVPVARVGRTWAV
jgi:hypothetical protein